MLPESGLAADGGAATVDPIAVYQITFGVPTLNRDARLTFDVYLAGLDAATASALLDAVTQGTATLVDARRHPGRALSVVRNVHRRSGSDGGRLRAGAAARCQRAADDGHSRHRAFRGRRRTLLDLGRGARHRSADRQSSPFDGLLPPYPAPPYGATPAFNRGRVIPLKFAWLDAAGARVDSADRGTSGDDLSD